MKKLLTAVLSVGLVSASFAADWVYDSTAKTVSDGDWTFNASVSGASITFNGYTGYPTVVTPLDFSKPVKSQDGLSTYTIVKLNPGLRIIMGWSAMAENTSARSRCLERD